MKWAFVVLFSAGPLLAQDFTGLEVDDDLNIGNDIFSDFNDDIQISQIHEDERLWHYGRYFSLLLGTGLTSFDGNRGLLYKHDPPGYGLGFYYFGSFQSSFGLGFQYSKHHFFIDQPVSSYAVNTLGFVDVSILRTYFGYRHYIDTTNLSTALTYSNPYFVGRMEYWYLTNEFIDQSQLPEDSGGGLGLSLGFGLEFPLRLKETYINLEFLVHSVNFHDKYTQDYAPVETNPDGYGFADLTGRAYTTSVNFVFNWGP